MGTAFFPLDERLALGQARLTPQAEQALVRLGSWMPFAKASEELALLLQVQVSPSTVRRQTLQVAQACLQQQRTAAQATMRSRLGKPERVSRLQMSVDGSMVPLVGGEWKEVKLLVIGQVEGEVEQARTSQLSYFGRLSDAQTFADEASAEIWRRGIERVPEVAGIADGAEWIQSFFDSHRTDSVRILDFAHAAQHLATLQETVADTPLARPADWLAQRCHQLKHEGPARLLRELRQLASHPHAPPEVREQVQYFLKREAQLQYPQFQAAGWPIGSGCAESGHKVLIQARLKGAGMHWKEEHVNPMLALRMAVCNDRWQESWQSAATLRRAQHHQRRQGRAAVKQQRLCWLLAACQVRLQRVRSGCLPPPPHKPLKGRTDAQRRWGRQTFSLRRLQQQGAKK